MRTFSLTTLVLAIAIGMLLLVSIFFVSANYISSQNAIERETSKTLSYRNKIAEIYMKDSLHTSTRAITEIASQFHLRGQLSQDRLDNIIKKLSDFPASQDGRYTDILALVKPNQKLIRNLSSPLAPKSREILSHYLSREQMTEHWRLVTVSNEKGKVGALIKSVGIVEKEYGQVLAYIVFGTSLAKNSPITNSIQQNAEVDGMELLNEDIVLTTPFQGVINNKETSYKSQTKEISLNAGSEKLFIRSYMKSAAHEELDAAYQKNLLMMVLISGVSILIAFVLIRKITLTSFRHLLDYSEELQKKTGTAHYEPGSIVEFNALGKALEEMMASVQKSQLALQESERTQRDILNNTSSVIYMKDLGGRYLFINSVFEKLFNLSNQDIIGKTDFDIFPRPNAEEFRANDQEVIETGELIEFEETAKNDDGEHHYISVKFPLKHADGRIYALCGISTDITERISLEEQVRRSQKMEAIGQLTGGIAHDFNNILGIVLGNLQLLQFTLPDDDEAQSSIEKAISGVQRGTDITRKLLGFSRKDKGSIVQTSVSEIIENLTDLISKSLTASINIVTDLDPEIWKVNVNPGDLQDAILNISLNAKDAMPEGGVLVIETNNKVLDKAYTKRNPGVKEGEYVMITISDTGTGISREIKEKIFEPFFTTKEQGRGTGLGLSLVYGFVQRSGGHIKIYSEAGKGTSIRIYLPRSDKDTIEETGTPVIQSAPPTGNETILVVDDEEALLEVAETYLTRLGYKVLTAISGSDALNILYKHQDIDMLFSDIIMPGKINGYQLATSCREKYPSIKILLTSGFTKEREKYEGGGSPFLNTLSKNILNKPYNQDELAQAIRDVLDKN